MQEILEYLDDLIKEYGTYVDEDLNLREDVSDNQSIEHTFEEIQFRYNSLVNNNYLLVELPQKGKDLPPERQVCISPAKSQHDCDFVIFRGKDNTDSIIFDTIRTEASTVVDTNQTGVNESVSYGKGNYNNIIGEDTGVYEDQYVDRHIIIGISVIASSETGSPENDIIADATTNNRYSNILNTHQSEFNALTGDRAGSYNNNDGCILDEDEAPMDKNIIIGNSQPSSSENNNFKKTANEYHNTTDKELNPYRGDDTDGDNNDRESMLADDKAYSDENIFTNITSMDISEAVSTENDITNENGGILTSKQMEPCACRVVYKQSQHINVRGAIDGEKEASVDNGSMSGIFTIGSRESVCPENDNITHSVICKDGTKINTHQRELYARIPNNIDSNLDPHGNVFSQQDAPLTRGIIDDTFDTDCGKYNSNDEINNERKEYQPVKMCQVSALSPHLRSTGKKPFKCEICGNCFQLSGSLTRHMRIHAAEPPFKCKICSHVFTQSYHLKSHLLIHTGEKPFKCTECNKRFRERKTLTVHMRIRTGEKPYRCDMCKKTFKQSCDLTNHKLMHTGEQKHKCETCDKSFKRFNSLLCHIRTHTREKQYTCTTCRKSFTDYSTRKQHTRSHTGEKPYLCTSVINPMLNPGV